MQSFSRTVNAPNKSLYGLLPPSHSLGPKAKSRRNVLYVARVAASEPGMRVAGEAATELPAAETDSVDVSYAPAIGALLTEEFPVDQVHTCVCACMYACGHMWLSLDDVVASMMSLDDVVEPQWATYVCTHGAHGVEPRCRGPACEFACMRAHMMVLLRPRGRSFRI